MNFVQQAAMNQVKSQAQNLIPKEVKDATNEEKSGNESIRNINDSSSNISNSNQSSGIPKKKKSSVISKALAIKMYLLLIIHTGILTIVEYIIHAIQNSKGNLFSSETSAKTIYWIVFAASIVAALLL